MKLARFALVRSRRDDDGHEVMVTYARPDAVTYEFRIRKGVTFHNGDRVTGSSRS